jgi:hypothetical protein
MNTHLISESLTSGHLTFGVSKVSRRNDGHDDVEACYAFDKHDLGNEKILTSKGQKDEGISPSFRKADPQGSVELIADSVSAVSARRRIVSVVQITASKSYEVLRPLGTILAARRIESGKLVAFASDYQAAAMKLVYV